MKYMYRGICIVNYDVDTKQVTFPDDEFEGGNIRRVRLLPEDLELLAEFFTNAHLHTTDRAVDADMTDIVVN
jgi:hypothetical protein